tara:strand:- start:162 stop:464 length:303 start_codon:yes stop_codon:yes gene_type:complete
MTREEWEVSVKEVYDNFTKEQFNELLGNTVDKAKEIINNGEGKASGSDISFNDRMHQLAWSVFETVHDSRRLSFKQFKMLSAFSKTDWLNINKEEEYKQF